MHEDKSIGRIVMPSYFSVAMIVLLTIYIFLTNMWQTASSYPVFSQLSNVLDERTGVFNKEEETFSILNSAVLNSAVLNNMVFLLAWAFVGVLVYVGFTILTKGLQHFEDFISITSAVNRSRWSSLTEIFKKIMLRTVITTVFVLFFVFFLQILLPLASLSIRAGAPASTFVHWQYLFTAFFMLILSMHLATILLRILVFRIRVFGGADELVLNE